MSGTGGDPTTVQAKEKLHYLFSNCILMVLYVSATKFENYKLVLSLQLDCCLYFFFLQLKITRYNVRVDLQ